MYRNKDNPDKTICKDALTECLNVERFIFCRDEKSSEEDMKFQECWDKLK